MARETRPSSDRTADDDRQARRRARGGQDRRADGGQREPGQDRRARAEARGQPAAGQRADPDDQAHRQQQQPGGQDRLMTRLLQEQRQAEQRPVQDQVEDHPDRGGAAEARDRNRPSGSIGDVRRRSARTNNQPANRPTANRAAGTGDSQPRWPAVMKPAVSPASESTPSSSPGRSGRRCRVERRLGDVPPEQEHGEHADGHVDQEDRPPAGRRYQRAAEHRAERHAQRAHAAPDAERARARPRVGELVHQQGERAGQQRRRAQALHARGPRSGRPATAPRHRPPSRPRTRSARATNTFLAPIRSAVDPAVSMIEARARV